MKAFALQFGERRFVVEMLLGGKSQHPLVGPELWRDGSGQVGHGLERQGVGDVCLGQLCGVGHGRGMVGNSCGHHQPVLVRQPLLQHAGHLAGRGNGIAAEPLQPAARNIAQWAMHQFHGGTTQMGHQGHGGTHATTAGVGEAANGIEKLPRWSGRAKHTGSGQIGGAARCQRHLCGTGEEFGFRHAARPDPVACEESGSGLQGKEPLAALQGLPVALNGMVGPHVGVHRRHGNNWSPGGKQRAAEQVVGEAVGEMRQGGG